MAYRFSCAHCNAEATVFFLKIGESHLCGVCGKTSIVPETAEFVEVEKPTEPVSVRPPTAGAEGPATSSLEQHPSEQSQGKYRPGPIVITGVTVNALWLILVVMGVIGSGLSVQDIWGMFWHAAVTVLSISVLLRKNIRFRTAAIVLNVIVFIFLGFVAVLSGNESSARLGGVMMVIVGAVNIVALMLSKEDSLVRLYFERKRLEEMKKISDLDKQIGEHR